MMEKVLVIGCAKSGYWVAKLLNKKGFDVTITDMRTIKEKTELEKKQEELEGMGEKDAFKKNLEDKKKQLEELKEAIAKQASTPGTTTNEDNVKWLIENHPEMKPEKMTKLFPHLIKGEGHFVAKFKKL